MSSALPAITATDTCMSLRRGQPELLLLGSSKRPGGKGQPVSGWKRCSQGGDRNSPSHSRITAALHPKSLLAAISPQPFLPAENSSGVPLHHESPHTQGWVCHSNGVLLSSSDPPSPLPRILMQSVSWETLGSVILASTLRDCYLLARFGISDSCAPGQTD